LSHTQNTGQGYGARVAFTTVYRAARSGDPWTAERVPRTDHGDHGNSRPSSQQRPRGHPRLHRVPQEIWRQIWSNNPNERLNKEIRHRTDVVGIFPDRNAIISLVGAVLPEQHDEWAEGRRYLGTTTEEVRAE
jgi:hypothetical protein